MRGVLTLGRNKEAVREDDAVAGRDGRQLGGDRLVTELEKGGLADLFEGGRGGQGLLVCQFVEGGDCFWLDATHCRINYVSYIMYGNRILSYLFTC